MIEIIHVACKHSLSRGIHANACPKSSHLCWLMKEICGHVMVHSQRSKHYHPVTTAVSFQAALHLSLLLLPPLSPLLLLLLLLLKAAQ